jgi:hypothetical protein
MQKKYGYANGTGMKAYGMEMPGDNQTNQSKPEVTFSIEVRQSTPAQIEAGKRFYSRLITIAQSTMQPSNQSDQIAIKPKTVKPARAARRKPPPV